MRVAWFGTDAGGRIHFTVAFRYAEGVENALRRRPDLLAGRSDHPRRRVGADFRRVLAFEPSLLREHLGKVL